MQSKDTTSDGEADQGVSPTFIRNTMISSTMVSGEASETDEEDEDDFDGKQRNANEEEAETEKTHFKDEQELDTEVQEFELETGAEVKTRRQKIVYKFDSPFHRKLRERNLELRSDLVEGLTHCYKSAGTRLESSTFYLSRAQAAAQDVSHNTSLMLEDLTHLSTLLESILASEKLFPLNVNVKYQSKSA